MSAGNVVHIGESILRKEDVENQSPQCRAAARYVHEMYKIPPTMSQVIKLFKTSAVLLHDGDDGMGHPKVVHDDQHFRSRASDHYPTQSIAPRDARVSSKNCEESILNVL